MFDIGFWELATLGVIALVVLGPERLPVVARTLGRWVGQAKGYVSQVTSELEKEVRVDEIRDEVRRAREQIESETRNVESEARSAVEPVMRPIEDDWHDDEDKSDKEPVEFDDSRMSLFSDNMLPEPEPAPEDDESAAASVTKSGSAAAEATSKPVEKAHSERAAADDQSKPSS